MVAYSLLDLDEMRNICRGPHIHIIIILGLVVSDGMFKALANQ
jgi:hypothetical protein